MRFHGISLDGIEIPRNSTGRGFTSRKQHGNPPDGIDVSRDYTGWDFTGPNEHGIPWDGINIWWDCAGRYVKTISHGVCTVHSKHSVSYNIVRLHF